MDAGLEALRAEMEAINGELLDLLSRRGRLAQRIGELKDRLGIGYFDPERERQMLQRLLAANPGPFSDAALAQLFTGVFRASADLMGGARGQTLQVHRAPGEPDAVIDIAGVLLGGGHRRIIAGPCALEREAQLASIAGFLQGQGVHLLRASANASQGPGAQGWEMLRRVADRFDLRTIAEVVNTRDVDSAARWVDVLQVGAGNLQNFELLRRVGQTRKPVLLTRGLADTLEAFILAAETLALEGNRNLILCEPGFLSFEPDHPDTHDLYAVPFLKGRVPFPVVVDLSHATGHRGFLPLGRAALAAGANGVMVALHPDPPVAHSDNPQPLSYDEFRSFHAGLAPFLEPGVPS